MWLYEEKGCEREGFGKRGGVRGWGWRREGCERAGWEEERVCEGGVGGREGV